MVVKGPSTDTEFAEVADHPHYPPESHTHARTETDLEKNTWKNKIPAHKQTRPQEWVNDAC